MEKELEDRFVKIENELKAINAKLSEIQKEGSDEREVINTNIERINGNLIKIINGVALNTDNITNLQENVMLFIKEAKEEILKAINHPKE